MPDKTRESWPQIQLTQALAFLEKNNFNGFLNQMALIGEWLQKNHHLTKYKDDQQVLPVLLREIIQPSPRSLTRQQALAFETLQNAWRDPQLTRLQNIRFVATSDPDVLGEPNTCLFLKIENQAFWQIIPVNAQGEKQSPIDLSTLDDEDVEEIANQLPDHLIHCKPENYPPEVARLKRALKQTHLARLDQGYLKTKASLRKEDRRRIKLGLETFKLICVENSTLVEPAENIILDQVDLERLDAEAQKAIREYKTGWQKIKRVIEYTLAALTAFAYGTVEMVATMLGFFVAVGVVWTNPLLAVVGVLLLAGAILFPIPSTWTNWKVFSTYLPAFFDNIADEYREINSPRKKALFWVLAVLAFATGIAAGGLAYTATIALPAMMGLGAIGVIFPPLGIILAAAITLTQTFTLIRNFTKILRKENSWRSFKKPFSEVRKFLNDNNASWGRRFVIWGLMLGLGLIALLGLAMSCFTSTRSVGKLCIDLFHTAPQKALICGIVISSVCSFFSRIYLTLSSTLASAINLSKRLFKSEQPPTPIPCKTKLAIATDSLLAGAFYAWSIFTLTQKQDFQQDIDLHLSGIGSGAATLLALLAGLTSFCRNSAISLDHAGKPENPHAAEQQQVTEKRVKSNFSIYRQQNPHCVFANSKMQKAQSNSDLQVCHPAVSNYT